MIKRSRLEGRCACLTFSCPAFSCPAISFKLFFKFHSLRISIINESILAFCQVLLNEYDDDDDDACNFVRLFHVEHFQSSSQHISLTPRSSFLYCIKPVQSVHSWPKYILPAMCWWRHAYLFLVPHLQKKWGKMDNVLALFRSFVLMPKLHYFDSLWTSWTTRC